jgi:BTB/POZ domain
MLSEPRSRNTLFRHPIRQSSSRSKYFLSSSTSARRPPVNDGSLLGPVTCELCQRLVGNDSSSVNPCDTIHCPPQSSKKVVENRRDSSSASFINASNLWFRSWWISKLVDQILVEISKLTCRSDPGGYQHLWIRSWWRSLCSTSSRPVNEFQMASQRRCQSHGWCDASLVRVREGHVTTSSVTNSDQQTSYVALESSDVDAGLQQQQAACESCRRRVRINVSGQHFEIRAGLLHQHPSTLLGDHSLRRRFYDRRRDELFFDRHRPTFESVFAYYMYGGPVFSLRWPSVCLLHVRWPSVCLLHVRRPKVSAIR